MRCTRKAGEDRVGAQPNPCPPRRRPSSRGTRLRHRRALALGRRPRRQPTFEAGVHLERFSVPGAVPRSPGADSQGCRHLDHRPNRRHADGFRRPLRLRPADVAGSSSPPEALTNGRWVILSMNLRSAPGWDGSNDDLPREENAGAGDENRTHTVKFRDRKFSPLSWRPRAPGRPGAAPSVPNPVAEGKAGQCSARHRHATERRAVGPNAYILPTHSTGVAQFGSAHFRFGSEGPWVQIPPPRPGHTEAAASPPQLLSGGPQPMRRKYACEEHRRDPEPDAGAARNRGAVRRAGAQLEEGLPGDRLCRSGFRVP